MRAAAGTRNPGPQGTPLASGWLNPMLASSRSSPAAAIARTSPTDSSSVTPPGAKSATVSRAVSGYRSGHTARTARSVSRMNRPRLSALPPYPSVRLLASGDQNDDAR